MYTDTDLVNGEYNVRLGKARTYTCIYTCIHTYLHTCIFTYTHTYAYIHIYIHTYIHTDMDVVSCDHKDRFGKAYT